MWHWDQGHLPYFQFDALRKISAFITKNEFKQASRAELLANTGLQFSAPASHSPWRNYSRVLKLCLLASERGDRAEPTDVARILADTGAVTCDEYLHFLIRAFTEPAPALENWRPNAKFRYPLLFSLKYVLAKAAIGSSSISTLDEIIGAYVSTNFKGDENAESFIEMVGKASGYARAVDGIDVRQPRESLKVIAQISFLNIRNRSLFVSLAREDAHSIFEDLTPVSGPRAADREAEIRRLASIFKAGSTSDVFDYPNTIISDEVESGFREGSRLKKTHIVIERNANLRKEFFANKPTAVCDVCATHTQKTYPWTKGGIIDLHHLLPLASGTRVESRGTTISDLVPVCPTCHRAVHRFYDGWLKDKRQRDFTDGREALAVYQMLKSNFPGIIHA